MSVFSQPDVDSDIYKLKLREEFIKKAKQMAGESFAGIAWDNPDDPFCCSGMVIHKMKINIDMGVVYAPYILSTDNH